ncbi:hypothetical protein E2542_SST28720 [Spatholobus suberectus]|nr:hypothetical protein E2542_SST28720 [Spatholobus suberectus]
MIDLLENCVSCYHRFVGDELKKEKSKCKSFLEFLREKFCSAALPLKSCISILCTHVATCHLLSLVCLNEALKSFQDLLFQYNLLSEGLEKLFSYKELPEMTTLSFGGAGYQLDMKMNV